MSARLGHALIAIAAAVLVAMLSLCANAETAVDAPPANLTPTTASASDILALARSAQAKDAQSVRRRWRVESQGLTGTLTSTRSGDDIRTDLALGPFTTSFGIYHGQHWRMTPNGRTILQSGIHDKDQIDQLVLEKDRVGPDDGVTVLGTSATPAAAYVLQVKPPGGRIKWLFIDPTSGRTLRVETVVADQRLVFSYSDFRAEGHETFAHEQALASADGTTLSTMTFLGQEENPAGLDLSIPPSARTLVEFPADKTRIDIPAQFLEGDHVIVRVNVGGRGLDLILDSGASTILLNEKVARELALPRYGKSPQTIVPEMDVADLRMRNVAVTVGSFGGNMTTDIDVVGLLGFDFIDGAVIHIDYEHHKVEAIRTSEFTPQSIPHAFGIPIVLDDGVPLAPVIVGDVLTHKFVVDTGADFTDIFPSFASEHPDDIKDQGRGDEITVRGGYFLFQGVNGIGTLTPTELRDLHFGPTVFTDFLAMRSTPGGFTEEDLDGLIGSPILSFYDLYFDYANARLVVVPNDKYRRRVREAK